MENMTLQYSSKDMSATDYALTDLFDLSLLRFQQRDDIAESFRKYGNKVTICKHSHLFIAADYRCLFQVTVSEQDSLLRNSTFNVTLRCCLL